MYLVTLFLFLYKIMAEFKQDFSITQSSDCKTIYLQDTSNFGSNDEGYTYSTFTTKTIGLYDGDGNLVGDLVNITNNNPVEYTLDKDRYSNFVYTLSNDSLTLTPVEKHILLTCFVELKFGEAIGDDCGCGCHGENKHDLCEVTKALKAADIFARRGNGVKAQDLLDKANEYIDCN